MNEDAENILGALDVDKRSGPIVCDSYFYSLKKDANLSGDSLTSQQGAGIVD